MRQRRVELRLLGVLPHTTRIAARGRGTIGDVRAWCLIVLTSVLAACGGDGDYRVVVRFADEATAMRADRIELALLGACGDVPLGDPPPEQVRRLEVLRGEPPAAFGKVDPGRAGLYGRAFDEDACALVAATCTPVVIEEDGGGELVIVLDTIVEVGCPGGTVCDAGSCTVTPAPGGEQWIDAECWGGDGGSCSDSFTGVFGTCYGVGGTVRCCAGCFDSDTERCEPGNTLEACGWRGEECDDCIGDDICRAFPPVYECR